MNYILNVNTPVQTCFVDITNQVREVVVKSGVKEGLCSIFVPHTTAAVTINENADSSVKSDMLKVINSVIPFENDYKHMEGNSAAHIKASLFGFSEQIIIENSKLLLGTWQGIYFCEFDGARNRKVHIKIMKDES